MLLSYLAEATIKTIALVFHAGLQTPSPEDFDRITEQLLEADGLGVWESVIRECTLQSLAESLPPDLNPMLTWARQKHQRETVSWLTEAYACSARVLDLLGRAPDGGGRVLRLRDLLVNLVVIRNKTKGHGAPGPDFFAEANADYSRAVSLLVGTCPAFAWDWYYTSHRKQSQPQVVLLKGLNPTAVKARDSIVTLLPGIHFQPEHCKRQYRCAVLLRCNTECTSFYLPNGKSKPQIAEFLDYSTGKCEQLPLSEINKGRTTTRNSETHGLETLDVQSNVFGNLPMLPDSYVDRPNLEQELTSKLLDRNHPVITLQGPGGAGKTYLALRVAHALAASPTPTFEYILWFSARSIDLRPSGPLHVRPRIVDLASVARVYGRLMQSAETIEEFALALHPPPDPSPQRGKLFIFDNLESMAEAREFCGFLDEHSHIPNKVLITSRERVFKADYPIEVRGMEQREAFMMMRNLARQLRIEDILDDDVKRKIYEYTQGHAYVMQLVTGEVYRARQFVPPGQVITQRSDIVNIVFESSYAKLSDCAREAFLIVTNSRSTVPEIALIVVLGERHADVLAGLEECMRSSLLQREFSHDDRAFYSAPQLARVFGGKKLQGDEEQIALGNCLQLIRQFGVVDLRDPKRASQENLITNFVKCCMVRARSVDHCDIERVDRVLERLAHQWPQGWLHLASFRRESGHPLPGIEEALRHASEELPWERLVWKERADNAQRMQSHSLRLACLVRAAESAPGDPPYVSQIASDIIAHITEHPGDFPLGTRDVYLASVRQLMEDMSPSLSATDFSRLAWLYLIEHRREDALRNTRIGLARDPTNQYCHSLLVRLTRTSAASEEPA